jgi:hypothetical protein
VNFWNGTGLDFVTNRTKVPLITAPRPKRRARWSMVGGLAGYVDRDPPRLPNASLCIRYADFDFARSAYPALTCTPFPD